MIGHSRISKDTMDGKNSTEQKNFIDLVNEAREAFPTIPEYFEDLSKKQKKYLYTNGAILTLFFLEKLDRIYKTILTKDWEIFKNNIDLVNGWHGDEKNKPWVYDFREPKTKRRGG